MTPDELREIDARIAVEVMGWTPIDRKAMGWGEGPPVWATGDEDNPTIQNVSPTTDPAASKLLLSKLREFHTVKIWISRDMVRVSIHHDANGMGVDEELEMAVCKAALAMAEAKGATV
jgi:hypothetical protein